MIKVMVPYNYQEFINLVTSQVNTGQINQSRIDDAVRRILRVKFAAGLFEKPMSDRSLLSMVGSQEHRDIAREAVRKSLVLLKNGLNFEGNPMLPLSKVAPKILVVGTHADDIGLQCGGWTISWQGSSGSTTIGNGKLHNIITSTLALIFDCKYLNGLNLSIIQIIAYFYGDYLHHYWDKIKHNIFASGWHEIKHNIFSSIWH